MDLVDDNDKLLVFSLNLPSLKELSLMKVARTIWMSENVISEFQRVQNVYREPVRKKFEVLNRKARSQTSLLSLPASFKKEVTVVINYFGSLLYHWIEPFEKRGTLIGNFTQWPDRVHAEYIVNNKLCWTAFGTLDYPKIAKAILSDQSITVKERFEIACNLCFEGDIHHLWTEMPSRDFYDKDHEEISNNHDNELVIYWCSKILDKPYRHITCGTAPYSLQSHDECLFGDLLKSPAADFQYQYFWPKLSLPQQKRHLALFMKKAEFMDVTDYMLFLLNKLNIEQQASVLTSDPWYILGKFLKRPWQQWFFKTWNLTKNHLQQSGFGMFLCTAFLDQCTNNFMERLCSEIKTYIRNERKLTTSLVFQLYCGNLDFVKEIMRDEPISIKLELIIKGCFDTTLLEPYEALDIAKDLIDEWVTGLQEWLELKALMKNVLKTKELSNDYEIELQNFFQTLDSSFMEC